ncbi:MAG: hypothetical protein Q8S84_09510 [bacterium]|nr:hypothetical protein [bacterium]MDP3381652.1 hypothetical protein [bacterium]
MIYFPENISIPIDSRLMNLFEKYKNLDFNLTPPPAGIPQEYFLRGAPLGKGRLEREVKQFYSELSKKLNISELHLDALVWVNYDELIN